MSVQEYENYLRRLQEANIARSELFGEWFPEEHPPRGSGPRR